MPVSSQASTAVDTAVEASADDALDFNPSESSPNDSMVPVQARYEFRATPAFLKSLGDLAEKEGIPRADVIRRAIGLYARARKEADEGRYLAFAKLKDDKVSISELIAL
jgi:hypothetical protein